MTNAAITDFGVSLHCKERFVMICLGSKDKIHYRVIYYVLFDPQKDEFGNYMKLCVIDSRVYCMFECISMFICLNINL